MKFRPTKRQLAKIGVLVCLLGYIGYGVIEPQTSPGHAIFHLAYSIPPTRPVFLRFYQWSLRKFNGKYLPSSIDSFLTARLWECEGSSEWRAIIDFQIKQGSGRWGDGFSHVHDEMKKRIITDIFLRLDTFRSEQIVDALVLIEAMRRSNALHKGGFANADLWTYEGNTYTIHEDRLAIVKAAFRKWWVDGSLWPANRSQDPLSGTGISIHEGP